MLGWAGKIAGIDLAKGTNNQLVLTDVFCRQWLGGIGFNAALKAKKIAELENIAEDAISFAVGPMVGSPLMGATVWVATAPNIYDAGAVNVFGTGDFGVKLKLAGWDQLTIWGAARHPSCLVLDKNNYYIERIEIEKGETVQVAEQRIREKFDGAEAAVLLFTADGIVSSKGLVCGSQAVGRLLAKRNLRAIVIQGNGYVKFADSKMVLNESCRASAFWRETGLNTADNGCLFCHGNCYSIDQEEVNGLAINLKYNWPTAVSLWLSVGFCPFLIMSGVSPWAVADLEKLLAAVTGCSFTTSDLWAIYHSIEKTGVVWQTDLREGLLNE